jgi:anaerobic magnesium-protoporphyrin IX monomethyl ester cyclase
MKIAFVQFSYGTVIGGAGYVMGALFNAGHDVHLFNVDNTNEGNLLGNLKNKIEFGFTVKNITTQHFGVIFFSCLSMDMSSAFELAHEIKKKIDIPIVMGGVHPTLVRGQVLDECPDIDFICVGEGESFAVEFVEKLQSGDYNGVKNLGYRIDGDVHINSIREPQDLKTLPAFPYHLYPRNYVVDAAYKFAYVKATRGCPYACTFCCNSAFLKLYPGKYLRYRPIDSVISEINKLKNGYHPKFIFFSDEMLLTDTEYAADLFRKIKTDTGIPFAFLARVEHLTSDIVGLAGDCGCRYIAIGVECGDEEFRKTVLNRRMTNDQIINAFDICRDNNIYTTSCNIIGWPFPKDDTLTESTVSLNKQLSPGFVQVAIFHPFPGTPLYEHCLSNNLIDPIKMAEATSCFEDSVLKGVSLTKKRDEIIRQFNRTPFLWGVEW